MKDSQMRGRIHKKMLICCVMVLGIGAFPISEGVSDCYGTRADAVDSAETATSPREGGKEVVIYRDSGEPANGGIGFAVREISRALKEKGYDVTDKPLEEFSRGSELARIVLTVEARERIERRLAVRSQKSENRSQKSESVVCRLSSVLCRLSSIGTLEPQGYAIRTMRNSTCLVVGADEVGAMYGGLEVAESIRINDLYF